MSSLIFNNSSSSPAQAGAGKSQLYAKDDGSVYKQAGTDSELALDSGMTTQFISVSGQKGTATTFAYSGAPSWNQSVIMMEMKITPSASTTLMINHINIGWYIHNYGASHYGEAPEAVYWIGRTIGSGTEIPIVYNGDGSAVSPETDLATWKAAAGTACTIWYLDHRTGGSPGQQFHIPWSHTFIDQPNTTEQVTYHLRGGGFDWEHNSGIQLGLYPSYSPEWTCEEKNLATNITTPQTQGQLGHGANWPVP